MDLTLREQVMVNQFILSTGCNCEQAKQLLQASNWKFEAALSLFLQDMSLPTNYSMSGHYDQSITPCNTPATPPNLSDTLIELSKLSTSNTKIITSSNNNAVSSCTSRIR